MSNSNGQYYGKYRGTVINNVDPLKLGRLQVQVPDVSISPSTWAMPCVPIGGLQMGVYLLPPPQAGVWIEFEHGDPDFPVWVGYWWGSAAEVPATALRSTPGVPIFALQTPLQNALVVSDSPVPPLTAPGVLLQGGTSSITVDPSGVTITAPLIRINGTVNITGPTNINNGALVVS
ncbi:MAG: phage baseplate assembly protein V [Cyanobacteria bacterium J06638_20]